MASLRGTRRRGGSRNQVGKGALERTYLSLGDRLGESLQAQIVSEESLAPRRTRARVAAGSIAVIIYVAVFALAGAGAAVLITDWSNPAAAVLGALMVGIAIVTCPRPYHRSRVRNGVSPSA